MNDPEVEIYDAVSTALTAAFPSICCTSEYVNAPASLPHASIIMQDCSAVKGYTAPPREMTYVMFEVNVYSALPSGRKTQCKQIMRTADAVFAARNFTRLSCSPVSNAEDSTIYRMVARYSALTDGDYFYRN